MASLIPVEATQENQTGIIVEGNPADWLITRVEGNFNEGSPGAVCPLSSISSPLTFQERGGFYRHDGVGFLLAPVGAPIAYLNSSVTYAGKGRVSFAVVSDMSGVQVDPGETRWGQQAILLVEKPNAALARQAAWVAQTHHARTDKGALSGWCSWYLKTSKITGEDILGIVDVVSKSHDRLRPQVIQIDDGYQDINGVWDANAKFPEGLPFYAKRIAETGARPGLWMAMTMIGSKSPWLKDPANMDAVWGKSFKTDFRPEGIGWLDPTHPRAKAHIAGLIRHAVTNGFTYLKLDFNSIGSGGWYEKKRTSFEIMRDHYTNIRQAAGEGTYILFCTEHPERATVGLVDASRTSSDAWRGGVRNSINQVLRSYDLNGRWFAVDIDCYYLATDLKGVDSIGGGWPMVRTYASMMGLSSGAAFTSDLWQWDVFRPHWRMTEILTPPARERTEILDLCTGEEWPRLLSKVQRPWGGWAVALLWNPGRQAQAITLDFARASLNPAHRYAVWSFWDNSFLGIATGRWITPLLPAGGCQHLCLTDLDSQAGQPVVIGSNLHIFCGAAEIKKVKSTPRGINLELTDAGARAGDLFIYSQKRLTAGTATGCTVTSVTAAGENVWKIHLEDRANDRPQTIGLSVVKGALAEADSLPLLKESKAPGNFEALWAGYDPKKEPLDIEVLKEWEEDGVVLRVLRYRIGVFKGRKAIMAAVYGFPKGGTKLPGLVQIHGGGQFADYKAPLTNAKRGYATISLAWAGRISAPGYWVDSDIVKLFWAGNTSDPKYKLTTDWGPLDAYHAPCRNEKNQFASVAPASWTLDTVDSPRNNSWFLCALAARRALTFLQQQPEVDPQKLGVYGHSMGGKITVMTAAADSRVKAAVPSCGGLSDRANDNPIYSAIINDNENLKRISCPILFLSPANDFHGRIDDLQKAVREISSKNWRITCSPHHNHQDTPEYVVAGPLWFDQHLKRSFTFPRAPEATLDLKTANSIPSFRVRPDAAKPLLSVDIYYTQQGQMGGEKDDRNNTISRCWHHADARRTGNTWTAELPIASTDKPLWVYANVLYPLEVPVTGAGYYYAPFTATQFNLSTLMSATTPAQLKAAGARATMMRSLVIENFAKGWQKEWFTYDLSDNWGRSTHKVYDDVWQAPPGAKLAIEIRSAQPNKLVMGLDTYATEIPLQGGSEWQSILLVPADFRNATGATLPGWKGIKALRLGAQDTLRSNDGGKEKKLELGGDWQGAKPEFGNLRWVEESK